MSIEFFGNMALEIFKIPKPKGTIIFADGLPSNPASKIDAINQWHIRKYDVVFPRYIGTWESKAYFLENPPQDDLQNLITALHVGITFSNFKYKADKIYLLGTSFGGGVILSLKDSDVIRNICALSPVISYKNLPDINSLASYLDTQPIKNYRFKLSDFYRLLEDKISSPANTFRISPKKVFILGGKLDNQINPDQLTSFSKEHSIKFYIDPEAGHITLSKLKPEHYSLIDRFFS